MVPHRHSEQHATDFHVLIQDQGQGIRSQLIELVFRHEVVARQAVHVDAEVFQGRAPRRIAYTLSLGVPQLGASQQSSRTATWRMRPHTRVGYKMAGEQGEGVAGVGEWKGNTK